MYESILKVHRDRFTTDKTNMKLLLFVSCIVVFGCSASITDNYLLQEIQQEIKDLKISNEALKKDCDEKIKSLEKNYGERIEHVEQNYHEKITSLEKNYDKKIARLEQQLRSGRNLAPQTGNFFVTSSNLCPFRVPDKGQLSQLTFEFLPFSVESPVAFSTRLTADTIINDSPVRFDVVDLNIGDGYDQFTGKRTSCVNLSLNMSGKFS